MNTNRKHYGFTLVEMLVVIVIIGILAAALIPKLTGLQARARDTARDADLRNIATAMEVYYIDHGGYPSPNFTASIPSRVVLSDILIPRVAAQTNGSTIDAIAGDIGNYLKSIPRDPRGAGVKASNDGLCIDVGDSYAYHSDGSTYYAITSRLESGKGNAATCGDTIDRNENGGYQKVGEGLITDIRDNPNYPAPSQWTPAAQFTFNNGVIIAYNGPTHVGVIIPATINGVPVTSIGGNAFQFKPILSVTIPNSVTSIGNYAFRGTFINSVTIPNSLTNIGEGVFGATNLTSVTIPNSVTSIGIDAFFLSKLTSVTIPNSVTSIGQKAFGNNNLTSVIISNSITSLGHDTFVNNNLTSVIIPNSVTLIGEQVFSNNKLNSITIPNSVTMIGYNAFSYNGPDKNSNNITISPIAASHGTRNIVGTSWVKQP